MLLKSKCKTKSYLTSFAVPTPLPFPSFPKGKHFHLF